MVDFVRETYFISYVMFSASWKMYIYEDMRYCQFTVDLPFSFFISISIRDYSMQNFYIRLLWVYLT